MNLAVSRHAFSSMDPLQAAGWFVSSAVTGSPAIAYAFTIGVAQALGAEFLVSGVDPMTAYKIFNRLLRHLGTSPVASAAQGRLIQDFSGGWPIALYDLPPEATARSAVVTYHEAPVRVVQVILSDETKRFPWHPGVDAAFSAAQCAFVNWRDGKWLH